MSRTVKWHIALTVALLLTSHLPVEAQISLRADVDVITGEMERRWGEVRGETQLIGPILRLLRQWERSDTPEEVESVADLLVALTVAEYGAGASDADHARRRIMAATMIFAQAGQVGGERLGGAPYSGATGKLLELATSLPEDGRARQPLYAIILLDDGDVGLRGLERFAVSGRSDSAWAITVLRHWTEWEGGANGRAELVLRDLHRQRHLLTGLGRRELDDFALSRGWPIPDGSGSYARKLWIPGSRGAGLRG